MKKTDGRSKAARKYKAEQTRTKLETAAQYESNMKQNADGSFQGQTGKSYKAMGVSGANGKQIGGDHYQATVQPWDAMEAWMSPEAFQGFLRGNAIKYLARDKNGLEDIKKAHHYLEKLIEVTI